MCVLKIIKKKKREQKQGRYLWWKSEAEREAFNKHKKESVCRCATIRDTGYVAQEESLVDDHSFRLK